MDDDKPPNVTDPRIGTRIGGYEVESFLGRGGMGVVYRARHTRLGRLVALKVLVPELAADETFRTRFVRESQMAASIDHPNVIPIYDADEIGGVLFLAMRYVEGTDLKVMIERDGALDLQTSLSVISQIAGALDAAHDLGLIHRDVKPANVLVERADDGDTHIYLTDFGLTKHGSSRSGITKTGAFIGTIDYIAPEQIEGNPVDARTDVYALGCVLYECLTGDVPFKKDADVAVMYAHMMDPRPKATDSKPELPPAVDVVLARAMARQPEDRYPSAGALADDLQASLGADVDLSAVKKPARSSVRKVVVAPPTRGKRALSPKLASLGLACLLVIAAIAYVFTRNEPREKNEPTASVPTSVVYVAPDGSEGGDGTRTAPLDLVTAIEQAGEGETVTLLDGTYEAQAVPMLVVDGSVTITADEDAAPVLQGDRDHPDGIYVTPGNSDVTISGIKFDDFDGEALKFFCEVCEEDPENTSITLQDLEFVGGGSPIIVENVEVLNVQRVKTEENFHTGLLCSPGPCNEVTIADSFFHSASQPDADGVNIESGDEVYIETSDASFNGRAGFVSGASNTEIIRSRATNNRDIGVSLTGSDSEIRDSIVALNRDVGLVMGEGGCEGCSATGTFKVVNVLVADNGSEGISVENDGSDEIKFQMFNSILTDNGGTALVVAGATRITRIDFNLFDTAGAIAVSYRGTNYSENKLSNSGFPGEIDAGTYASTPEFVAPGDYHLAPGSGGVDGGTQEGVVSQVDIDGNPRVAGEEIDKGPYEQS